MALAMQPGLRGAAPVNQKATETWELTFEALPGGGVRLAGAGQDLTLAPDPERRFLFDRDFSWAPRVPVNR